VTAWEQRQRNSWRDHDRKLPPSIPPWFHPRTSQLQSLSPRPLRRPHGTWDLAYLPSARNSHTCRPRRSSYRLTSLASAGHFCAACARQLPRASTAIASQPATDHALPTAQCFRSLAPPLDNCRYRDRRQPTTTLYLVSSLASLLVRKGGKCCYVLTTPVVLTLDYRNVVTRISLSIGATIAPSPASRAATHHRIHVGMTTPHRAGR
jgi:hypothetical protein